MRRIERLRFLVAAAALAGAPLAMAQPRAALPLLAILSPNPHPTPQFIADNPFSNRLRNLGWIEGRTLTVERFYAGGREDRLAGLAEDLVRRNPNVIWAVGPEAALAAARARARSGVRGQGAARGEGGRACRRTAERYRDLRQSQDRRSDRHHGSAAAAYAGEEGLRVGKLARLSLVHGAAFRP